MKRGLLISILLSITLICHAGEKNGWSPSQFTYGVEWSYCSDLLEGYHYYFIAPEGFRVEERNNRFCYRPNGELNVHFGYNFNSKWNLSLYIGYAGISDFHTGFPISVRGTRFLGEDHLKDRWFVFADAGSGVCLTSNPKELLTGRIGGGYRLSMSRLTKLDFIFSIRYIHTHPEIRFYNEIITQNDIDRNSGHVVSATIGIGITF